MAEHGSGWMVRLVLFVVIATASALETGQDSEFYPLSSQFNSQGSVLGGLRRKRHALAEVTKIISPEDSQQQQYPRTAQSYEDEYGRELGEKAMALLGNEVAPMIMFMMESMSMSFNHAPSPSSTFDLTDCDSYATLWLSDLAHSCFGLHTFPDGCNCDHAETLISSGEIVCDSNAMGYVPCPDDCAVCELCMGVECI